MGCALSCCAFDACRILITPNIQFQVACGEQHNLARVLLSSRDKNPASSESLSSGSSGSSSIGQQAELWVWGGGRLGQVLEQIVYSTARFTTVETSVWDRLTSRRRRHAAALRCTCCLVAGGHCGSPCRFSDVRVFLGCPSISIFAKVPGIFFCLVC